MKIGVVGTFIRDRILPWQGQETRSIGGIFFTVSYLANLLDEAAEIYPVCFVGEDFYDEVTGKLADCKNVAFDGIVKLPRDNTQVRLTYTRPQERDEVTTDPMPPLGSQHLDVLQDADAVIVNLITGQDVSLAGLHRFRQESDALIYLDFHSHALGINSHGKRYYKKPADWRDWVRCVDVLQLNEMEARTLAGCSPQTPAEILVEFGREVLRLGPSVCHITLAEKGSYLLFGDRENPFVKRLKAVHVDNVLDIIGCGDAFEAAYLVAFLSSGDVLEATRFAHSVAAANCSFVGSSGITSIKEQVG